MVNGTHSRTPALAGGRIPASARADLVNSGQDTLITLRDGSTIMLKGVTRIEAVFSGNGANWEEGAPPIGGALPGATKPGATGA
jgi:hypothetical protein